MSKRKDAAKRFIGNTFNNLTILGIAEVEDKKRSIWVSVKCKCGTEKNIRLYLVTNGVTKSCGCIRNYKLSKRSQTHGLSGHPLYNIWGCIKSRCYNKKVDNYKYYGGSGIIMCDEWKNDFLSFYNWCIKNGWQDGLEVDRYPDKSGNYEPTNCRLATREQQMNNTSKNVLVLLNGQQYGIKELSTLFNIKKKTLEDRIRYGWPIEKVLTKPIKTHRK